MFVMVTTIDFNAKIQISMIKISSILVGVRDLSKARPFYEKVFGFVFDEFRPPYASATVDGLEFNIEEDADYRSPDWVNNYIGGRKNVAFQTDDLKSFLIKAEASGAKVIQEATDQPWGWSEAVIADPDGNEFLVEQEII